MQAFGLHLVQRFVFMDEVGVAIPDRFRLTERELLFVEALRRGETSTQIAAAHGLSRRTVKNYLTVVYSKLGIKGRSELMDVPEEP
jgi:DNA-binding NarL/FixJ family response regulator